MKGKHFPSMLFIYLFKAVPLSLLNKTVLLSSRSISSTSLKRESKARSLNVEIIFSPFKRYSIGTPKYSAIIKAFGGTALCFPLVCCHCIVRNTHLFGQFPDCKTFFLSQLLKILSKLSLYSMSKSKRAAAFTM